MRLNERRVYGITVCIAVTLLVRDVIVALAVARISRVKTVRVSLESRENSREEKKVSFLLFARGTVLSNRPMCYNVVVVAFALRELLLTSPYSFVRGKCLRVT